MSYINAAFCRVTLCDKKYECLERKCSPHLQRREAVRVVQTVFVCTNVFGVAAWNRVSQTFLLADPFWLRRITTDPHTLLT
jgi:hypothetical protein